VPGCLPMGIGDNCTIRHCIVDKNARIGSDVQIVNKEGVQESNREDDGYVIKASALRISFLTVHSSWFYAFPGVYAITGKAMHIQGYVAEHRGRGLLV